MRRQAGAHAGGETGVHGEHDLVEAGRVAVGNVDRHPTLGRDRDVLHAGAELEPDALGLEHLDEAREDAGVAAGHVAEHLLLQPAAAGRVQPLRGGPDERGRRVAVRLAELGPQQRQPEPLVRASPGPPSQPVVDGDLLEAPPVPRPRRVEDGAAEPHLVDEAEDGEPGEVDRRRDRPQRAVGEETRLGLDPVDLVVQAELVEDGAEMRVGEQGHVVVAVPGDVADGPGAGEPADLSAASNTVTCGRAGRGVRERQPEHPPAHDRPALAVGAHAAPSSTTSPACTL